MTEISYPTVDLFLYDLIENLGRSEDIEKNREYFKNKLPENLQHKLLITDNDYGREYVHLLDSDAASLPSHSIYEGYYYPVKLGDTYGLLIDCTTKEQNEPQPTESFQDIKKEIEQNILKNQKGTIGQTWMISGWLPPSLSKNPTPIEIEEVAKDCYKNLMPDLDWSEELDGKGEYLGATFFELSSDRLVKEKLKRGERQEEIIQNSQHTIIVIYPDRDTLELSGKFYADWMRLFHYHHKIIWAYGQSRSLKQTMKTYFTEIKSSSQSIGNNKNKQNQLKKLNRILQEIQYTLNDYTTGLNNLDFQEGTIDINLSNYHERISNITEKSKKLSPDQPIKLQLFEEFAKLVSDKYLLQISKDKENLERGLKLLENTINATRSRVEVEKAQSDRNFQELVAVVGAGLATVSLFIRIPKGECKALFNIPDNLKSNEPKNICDYPFSYSLIVGLIAAILTWSIRRLLKR